MLFPLSVVGAQLLESYPTTVEGLLQQGPDFLTQVFHASGALPGNNAVVAITQSKEFFGGGMGRKLLLSVRYQHDDVLLHRDLFVKFPRNFGDPLRDLFAPLMEPEVRFALLSRRADFPITVPKCYFADYDPATLSGILITERIMYGNNGIEACHPKCLDYAMPNALEHYRALTRAVARLAGFYQGGRFGPDVEGQFPFDPQNVGSRLPYDRPQLTAKLAKLRSFITAHPQLFPPSVASQTFLDQFVAEVPLVLELETRIKSYLAADPDYIALCHWNANVDNAWFFLDADHGLCAGLLDWGSVGAMNVAQSLYGLTCAAEVDFLNEHRGSLLELFTGEYRAHGGARIDADGLEYRYKLAVALLGVAWILDAPSLIEAEIPDSHHLADRFDVKIKDVFLARAQLQLLTVFLNEWLMLKIGSTLHGF